MKWADIKNALNKIISEKLKINPYSEDIDNVKKPCFYIDLVSYKKEFNSEYRELKTIDIDIIYYPKTNRKLTNAEILENLENLDDAFEIEGKKVLHVLDRYLTLRNTDITIVDRVGHYIFTLSLYNLYGRPYDYELMKDLELRFKEGGSN